ncbi:SWIM zinc finger family protein [Actinomadura kijaniata]|uniref:SWIM zinc finger family protein n=1 Tax=Actinomadura kijaniata TaxID=46161 RepID=UPI00082BDD0A|nr:SWIM zinc finger family protein [Actinomadura kijaniata]
MSDRWDREHVLGLAPDDASAKAAGKVAVPAKWRGLGADDEAVWGECAGSGKSAYRACVDLTEPAFRCSCPSRKFPCKHALGLLLLWSDGVGGETVGGAGERPAWVVEWIEERRQRAEKTQRKRTEKTVRQRDPKTAERREQRVDGGIADLDQWLRDQVAHGLAQAENAPYRVWDEVARRLVDAQAGALAGQVRGLASVARREGWPDRLLEEYALLRLLVRAHQRREELPEGLRETVRARIGFTLSQEEVLERGERVRDRWCVVGSRDVAQEQLTTRRVWLKGRASGRHALVLSFAAPGRTLDASLVVGTEVEAELAFYPGARPLRALVAERFGAAGSAVPDGVGVGVFLKEYAAALADDPWLERWPAVLAGVRLGRDGGGLFVVDDAGDALPLRMADPWRLLAVSGGAPVTFAGEWSTRGMRPLAAWHPDEKVVIL